MHDERHDTIRQLLIDVAARSGPGGPVRCGAVPASGGDVILDRVVADILLTDGRRPVLIGISVNSDDGLLGEITLLSDSANGASTLPVTNRADHPVAPIRQAISAADGCGPYRHSIPGR